MLVLSCVPGADTLNASQSPCTDISGVHYLPQVADIYVLTQSQIDLLNSSASPLDSEALSQSFAIAFSAVIFCWLLGRMVGAVLESIRR